MPTSSGYFRRRRAPRARAAAAGVGYDRLVHMGITVLPFDLGWDALHIQAADTSSGRRQSEVSRSEAQRQLAGNEFTPARIRSMD